MALPLKIRIEYFEKLSEIFEYYRSINEDLAIRFYHEADAALLRIEENPQSFQIQTKNYRQILLKNFPYQIIYELTDTEIIVYILFPARSNPEKRPK